MRRTIIAGNWKMNKTATEAAQLAGAILAAARGVSDVDIVVCPTYPALKSVHDVIQGSNVKLGAQDLHWEDEGAFTGKVSAAMLLDVGVEYVIIGHSEQRTYFHETNETVNKKLHKALVAGLKPIVCIGETLEERESGKMEAVLRDHVSGALQGVSAGQVADLVLAYEPVWAIGTGKVATTQQAEEAQKFVRGLLTELYDSATAEKTRIQYGGSMKPDNAKDLLAQANVDGGLIGGASLKADSFLGIIQPG